MRIVVKAAGGRDIKLLFPTGIMCNSVMAGFLPKMLKQNGVTITRKQAVAMVKALNDYRHSHRDWNLVEVESSGGEYIEIKL